MGSLGSFVSVGVGVGGGFGCHRDLDSALELGLRVVEEGGPLALPELTHVPMLLSYPRQQLGSSLN